MNQHAHAAVGLFVGMALFSPSPSRSAETTIQLKLDAETTIVGVGIACTGIGGTKHDPRWLAYPVRVEFANSQHEYLLDAIVTLSDVKGAPMFTVFCPGAWLLLKLPDRSPYHLDARLSDANTPPQSAIVKAPAQGQTRVVLTFPGM